MSRRLAVLLLLITTMLWGFAFVAQKSAMSAMGPLTFAAARYLLGAVVLAPLVMFEMRRRSAAGTPALTTRQWLLVGVICLVFFFGSILQQWGLTVTTVTNGGFLTGLYVFFTPLFGWLIYRHRPHPILYLCVPMALLGLFWLNGGRLDGLSNGDLLVILCAVFWGVQVLMLGSVARETGLPIGISWICFVSTGLLSLLLAPAVEAPTLAEIASGWAEILYAGILSTAVAFTLQAIAQQYVPPANAAIILSTETLFAAIGGALLMGDRLLPIGYAGAALIFIAVVLVEAMPVLTRRSAPAAAP